jgi:hypothetical protein
MQRIYIGRDVNGLVTKTAGLYGWLGNPIKVGALCPCGKRHRKAGTTIKCYRRYMRARWRIDADFRDELVRVAELWDAGEASLHCPGCDEGADTCHGRALEDILRKLAAQL